MRYTHLHKHTQTHYTKQVSLASTRDNSGFFFSLSGFELQNKTAPVRFIFSIEK